MSEMEGEASRSLHKVQNLTKPMRSILRKWQLRARSAKRLLQIARSLYHASNVSFIGLKLKICSDVSAVSAVLQEVVFHATQDL